MLSFTSGALLIKAGPGTGKTHCLTAWIEYLITSGLAVAGEILAITFTNKAAREMAQRLAGSCGAHGFFAGSAEPAGVKIATFHSFCYSLLQEEYPQLNIICDHRKRLAVVEWLLPQAAPGIVRQAAAALQQHLENPALPQEPAAAALEESYLAFLARMGAVDLAGLISGVNRLFAEQPQVWEKIRGRYRYLAVDEFQDLNREQYRLISGLAAGNGVLAIGDPDQAIYGFRGADPGFFFRFREEQAAGELVLFRNYRSCSRILQAASALIAHNTQNSGLTLAGSRSVGDKIRLCSAPSLEWEAHYILREIEQLLGGLSMHMADSTREEPEKAYAFSDIAILFRLNAAGMGLLPFFKKAGIPAGIRGQEPLLWQEPFSLLSSILCCLLNDRDLPALQDCLLTLCSHAAAVIKMYFPEPGNSGHTCWQLLNQLTQAAGISPADQTLVQEFGCLLKQLPGELAANGVSGVLELCFSKYLAATISEENRYGFDCIREMAASFGSDLAGFYRQVVLSPNESEYPYRADKVNFLTFHAAKGLEFPVVFIVGAEQGILPVDRQDTDPEEERRLLYVAMTRARDRLYISRLEQRWLYGKKQQQQPSSFLRELPCEHCTEIQLKPAAKQEEYRQGTLF